MNAQMLLIGIMSAVLVISAKPILAQEPTKPVVTLKETVTGMPKGDKQEIRVLTASFVPSQATVFHTHRFPVTVFLLEGTFTLEMEGRPPVAIKAGQSFVEPPNVRMTGYNRSATEPIKLVIFYVSDLDTPFLDVVANK